METFYLRENELDKIQNDAYAYKQALKNLGKEENLLKTLNDVYPGASLFFEFKETEEGTFLNRCFAGYERNGIHYAVYSLHKPSGKPLYRLFSSEVYEMERNIGFRLRDSYPKQPNNIGVFSQKKIEDWMEYIDKVHTILVQDKQEAESFKEAYLNRLECEEITWLDKEHSRGKIIRGGLILEFRFSGSHVYESMELDYRKRPGYDLFKAMADNRYTEVPMG